MRVATRRPQNGTQAHAMSHDLEFGRPAHGGATPCWDRPSSDSKISFRAASRIRNIKEKRQKNCNPCGTKCYLCPDPKVLPMS